MQQRQNRRECVFGEELLAAQYDDKESNGVAELGNERPPGSIGQVSGQQSFRDQRKSHREPRRQPRPGQRYRRALELFPPFLENGPENDMGRGRGLFVDFVFFPFFLFGGGLFHRPGRHASRRAFQPIGSRLVQFTFGDIFE